VSTTRPTTDHVFVGVVGVGAAGDVGVVVLVDDEPPPPHEAHPNIVHARLIRTIRARQPIAKIAATFNHSF